MLIICLALFTSTIILPPPKASASIATRGTATTNFNNAGVTSLTINKPTGVVAGDIMIASIITITLRHPTLAGWTLIDQKTPGGTELNTLWHLAGGSEPASYTFSTGVSSGAMAGGIIAFSGVDNVNPIDNGGASHSTASGNTGTPATATAFTTTSTNTMIVASFGQSATGGNGTGSPSMNEEFDVSATGGSGMDVSGNTLPLAAAGSTGAKTSVITASTWEANMVALAPPPVVDQANYRFLSNLDVAGSTFVTSNPSANDDTIRGLATDTANGFFYIGGYTATDWIVQKRNISDGSLVAAFAYPAGITGNIGGISLDPTGNSIYIAGNSGGTWRIEKRRTSDAALCTTANGAGLCGGSGFGPGGAGFIASGTGFPSAGSLNSVDIDGVNGFIYVGGYDSSAPDDRWIIGKYSTSTGSVAAGFSQATGTGCSLNTGYACDNPGTGSDRIRTISVDPQNGYVYAGGWWASGGASGTDWRMEKRRTSDGALCTAAACGTQFATNGVYTEALTGTDQILTFQVDTPGNAIYVGGYDAGGNAGSSTNEWRLEKLDATAGTKITAFGTSGVINYDSPAGISGADDQLLDLGLDGSGGFIYTTGQVGGTTAADLAWRIEKRKRSDGSLVTGFGNYGCFTNVDGSLCVNPSTNPDAPAWISVDLSRNLLYTSGGDRTLGAANQQWRIQKFDLDHGDIWLDTPQDTAAIASTKISFRLRMLLRPENALGIGALTFKLQYAPKVGTCDTGFVGENYQDVTSATTEIQYHDNASLADGATSVAISGSPTDGANPTVQQTIEEANNFTSIANIPNGSDGSWDFVMHDSNAFGAYCFRAIYSDNTDLTINGGTYFQVPEINFCRNTPTTDALLRSGTYFCSGVKRAFFWAQ